MTEKEMLRLLLAKLTKVEGDITELKNEIALIKKEVKEDLTHTEEGLVENIESTEAGIKCYVKVMETGINSRLSEMQQVINLTYQLTGALTVEHNCLKKKLNQGQEQLKFPATLKL